MPKGKFLFGKRPARIDNRTIKLKNILRLKLLPDLPETYDLHKVLGVADNFMFGNDRYGDCVKAAQAHQILVAEKSEQGIQIAITDQEVIDAYLAETGGGDNGLYLLDSLKVWRNEGFPIGGKLYKIYAFASVEWKDHDEVKHCIHLLGGVNFGMEVYSKDMEQFKAGKVWEITSNSGLYQGGHGVYLPAYITITGYNEVGPVCVTWGKRQQMTWEFWDVRVDEAYGIVDNRDDWLEDSPVDVKKLDGYLQEITEGNAEPSSCPIANLIVSGLNKTAEFLGSDTRIPRPIKIR